MATNTLKTLSKISLYYHYWEDFVSQWHKGTAKAILGWSDPDKTPALCNMSGGTPSSLYIPEPWWGNDGSQPLHSVVINFNPGRGGKDQERGNVPRNYSYADIVNSTIEPDPKNKKWPNNTANWHKTRRADPVQKAICPKSSLESHLSVELIPWHTAGVDNKTYIPYLKHNIKAVYEHSICFAAYESGRIQNDHLKNVVLLKMSGNFTKYLLDNLGKAHCCKPRVIIEGNVGGKANYLEFSLDTWPDVRFISIWGKSSRNNFPVSCMGAIFLVLGI